MRLLDGIINKALFQFYNLFEPKLKSSEPAESVMKLFYLTLHNISKKWVMDRYYCLRPSRYRQETFQD